MKRCCLAIVLLAALSLAAAFPARAQMGMDIFKRPSITKAFHPAVGKGAAYLSTDKDGKTTRTTEIYIVGKDSVDGKEGFWMEFMSDNAGKMTVGKVLITLDDFQFHRMIVQPAGQPAMEMPMNMNLARKNKMEDSANDWHSVGTESVTVLAGTFSCEHWRNDKNHSDIWTADKVTPFGMVKEVDSNGTQVLVKLLDNATDRITGPVKVFDMQEMMQQMQQQRQQKP